MTPEAIALAYLAKLQQKVAALEESPPAPAGVEQRAPAKAGPTPAPAPRWAFLVLPSRDDAHLLGDLAERLPTVEQIDMEAPRDT
jgi:hypothetical protein